MIDTTLDDREEASWDTRPRSIDQHRRVQETRVLVLCRIPRHQHSCVVQCA